MFVSQRGRDRLVGITTRYGLDGGLGIESQWRRFSAPVQTGPATRSASYTMGTGSFPGVNSPELGLDQSPSSSAEVKENVELYFFDPSGSSW